MTGQNWLDAPIHSLPSKTQECETLLHMAMQALIDTVQIAQPYTRMLSESLTVQRDENGNSSGYLWDSFLICQSTGSRPVQIRFDGVAFMTAWVEDGIQVARKNLSLSDIDSITATSILLSQPRFEPVITLRNLADGLRDLTARVRRIQALARPSIEEFRLILP